MAEIKTITATDGVTYDIHASVADSAVIDAIQVNGTAQTITDKTVNITVPTDNSQIGNGAGYATTSYVDTKIGDIATALAAI